MRKVRVGLLLALAMVTLAGLGACVPKYQEPEATPAVARPANDPAPEDPKGKAKRGAGQANPSRNE